MSNHADSMSLGKRGRNSDLRGIPKVDLAVAVAFYVMKDKVAIYSVENEGFAMLCKNINRAIYSK